MSNVTFYDFVVFDAIQCKSLETLCTTCIQTKGVELESEYPGVRVLVRSWSLSFEGDSDSGTCLSHLDFCVILLQST